MELHGICFARWIGLCFLHSLTFKMEFLKDVSPREYQKKIFETCVEKNCLVVLPTGLGKTLIALMLTIDRMKKFPGKKVIFLAPTRPLAEQHFKYFEKHLPELFGDLQLFTGEISASARKKIWQTADIIFSTPQCIANDVKNGLYSMENISLLIEDEAHKCLKNYSYTFVAKKCLEQAKNLRIIGLTASPGSEMQKIKEICKNLSIEDVELKTRDSNDVKSYLQKMDFEKVLVDFPEEFEEMRIALRKIFDNYVGNLKSRNILFGPPTKTALINLQKKISNILSGNTKNFSYYSAASACAQAIKIQHALELLETQTLRGFNNYIESLMEQSRKGQSKGVKILVAKPEFIFVTSKIKDMMSKNLEHPKVEKLSKMIVEEMASNQKTKIIVFMQFRDTASLISEKLNEIPGLKSEIFIGQAKKTSKDGKNTGMSQKDQKKIIEDFSNGKINILCATSIGEEGLDIPEVNAVIFYEAVASAIRKIQRAGRTARQMKGKTIMLLTKNTRDESFHYASMSREKKMHSVMGDLKESLKNPSIKESVQEKIGTYF